MPRRPLALAAVLAVTTAGLAACGGEHHEVTRGHTEAVYLTVGHLKYQVQISRPLNPADPEDREYLTGIPLEERSLEEGQEWFGVFMRVENDSDESHTSASEFVIEDTTGAEFEPVEVDTTSNSFAYEPLPLQPGDLNPPRNSPAADSTTQGALLLFKMTQASLENRPLELIIEGPAGAEPARASVDLDV